MHMEATWKLSNATQRNLRAIVKDMKLLILFPKENNPKSLIGFHFQLHKSLRIFLENLLNYSQKQSLTHPFHLMCPYTKPEFPDLCHAALGLIQISSFQRSGVFFADLCLLYYSVKLNHANFMQLFFESTQKIASKLF